MNGGWKDGWMNDEWRVMDDDADDDVSRMEFMNCDEFLDRNGMIWQCNDDDLETN